MNTKRDTQYHRQTEYTDTCVLAGPDLRWVENAYRDLKKHAPEALLGYNVLLIPVSRLGSQLQGRKIAKVILLEGDYGMWGRIRMADGLHGAYHWDIGMARVEEWSTHFTGCRRIS